MKVLLPNLTTHTITLEPRVYPTTALSVKITNEASSVVVNVVPTYVTTNGVTFLTFVLVGLEGERFTVKLTQDNIVIYRCKLFFTAQTPQDYKITKDKYTYA